MKSKKFLKVLAALTVGTVMASSFAFAACDNGSTDDNGGDNTTTTHSHVWSTSGNDNGDGTHTLTCSGEGTCDLGGSKTENHNTSGTDNECTVCGYKPGDSTAHSHVWSTSGSDNGDGTHTVTCSGEGTCDLGGSKTENHNTNGTDNECTVCGYKPTPGGEDGETKTSWLVADGASDTYTVEEAPVQITDNALLTVSTAVSMQASRGKQNSVEQDIDASVNLKNGTSHTFNYGIKQSENVETGDGKTATGALTITAKDKNLSLRIYVNLINDSYNSTRNGKIYYSNGVGLMSSVANVEKTAVQAINVNVAAGETVTIYAVPDVGSNGSKLWFFGVEAEVVASVTSNVATSITADKATKAYELSGSELVLPVDDVVITAKDASNNSYALDLSAWDVTNTLTKDSINVADLKITEAGSYELTVTATPKNGGSALTASPIAINVTAPITGEHTYNVEYQLGADGLVAVWGEGGTDVANNITVAFDNTSSESSTAFTGYSYRAQIKNNRFVKVTVGENLADVTVEFIVGIGTAGRTAYFGTNTSDTASGYLKSLTGDDANKKVGQSLKYGDGASETLGAGDYYLYGTSDTVYFLAVKISYTINKGV